MQRRSSTQPQQKQLRQAMQILSTKFILNLPKQQQSEKSRLAYHYKKAYYYFIDNMCKKSFPDLQPKQVQLKWFIDNINSILNKYIKVLTYDDVIKILNKQRPTCGAIIFNVKGNKALVVSANGRYGFPKGQKNQYESCEDCAAREVKEEVGLFVHRIINGNQKVQFQGRQDASATFFIIQKFDETQKLTIDRNEIDDAFWMNVADISKYINKFSQKCRQAWRKYQQKIQLQSSLSMEQFLNIYRQKQNSSSLDNKKQVDINVNPLLNFSLDRNKLFAVFRNTEL